MASLADFFRTPQYRNKYVLRRTAGHPGNSYTIVFGTREDLGELGKKLVEEAQTGSVRVHNYVTIEHGRNSRIYLEFQSVTAQQIDDWHKTSLKYRVAASVKPLFYLALFVFAVIGFRSLLS
jgi:hypothetical protein